VLVEGLNEIEGVFCPKPTGAFYAIAELPVDDADKFAQWLLEDFELDGETIMVAPAAGFYATPNTGTRQVRIAYVLNKESLQKSIAILAAALKVYPGKTL
jgi:aspartate aminotransferase